MVKKFYLVRDDKLALYRILFFLLLLPLSLPFPLIIQSHLQTHTQTPHSSLHLIEELLQRAIDFLTPLQLHPMRRIQFLDPQICHPRPHPLLLQPRHRDVVFRACDEQGWFRDVAVLGRDGGVVGEVDVGEHGFVPAELG